MLSFRNDIYCSVTQSCLTLAIQWNAACQASLSFIMSQSLLKFMSIESVMPSNQLILCCPLLLLPLLTEMILPTFRFQPYDLIFTCPWRIYLTSLWQRPLVAICYCLNVCVHHQLNGMSLWWTGRPGRLQSMGSQRVGYDWVTKLNWIYIYHLFFS